MLRRENYSVFLYSIRLPVSFQNEHYAIFEMVVGSFDQTGEVSKRLLVWFFLYFFLLRTCQQWKRLGAPNLMGTLANKACCLLGRIIS